MLPLRRKPLLAAMTLITLGAAFLLPGSHSEVPDTNWAIDLDGKIGKINSKISEADLLKMYGPKNVTHGTLDVGEGETMPATIIFASLPQQRLEIAWRDEPGRKFPTRIQIGGKKSLWHTTQGITLGTSLKILEKLNDKPFLLAGFSWDYSGTVTSWNQGHLEQGLKNVVLRLAPPEESEASSKDEESVLGDGNFSSADPSMQKINPVVYQLIWLFN
jgi:hypothetical protein